MTGHYDEQTIHEYVDGRLSGAARVALRMHLDICPACAALHRGVVVVDGILRTIPREQAGRHMTETVLARIMLPRKATLLDRMLRPRVLAGGVLVLFGAVGGAGAILTASLEVPGNGLPVAWERVLGGSYRGIGVLAEAVSGWITGMVPQLFSAEAVQVTLAVMLVVPLFLWADHVLAKRRLIG